MKDRKKFSFQPPFRSRTLLTGLGMWLFGLASLANAKGFDPNQANTFVFDKNSLKEYRDAKFVYLAHQPYSQSAYYGADLATEANSGRPFYFSIRLPDGNYRVEAVLGSDSNDTHIGIKAESRRLYLTETSLDKGEFLSVDFIVNVRSPKLTPPELNAPGGSQVLIKSSEENSFTWDEKLTLEFLGDAPFIKSIRVEPVNTPVIYLLGDSTVTDQAFEPAASWGQMLPYFFNNNIAIANHAESGETIKSFISSLRLAKVLETLKAGDYVLIQFGHNDQKKQWPQTYVEANTTYRDYLRVLIGEVKRLDATPVLVTSMQRRNFDAKGRVVNTHGDYPKAVRELGQDLNVPVIDLDTISQTLYPALEPHSHRAFNDQGRDKTHHNNYGAYLFAAAVASEISRLELPLKQWLKPELTNFNPHHPPQDIQLGIPTSMKQSAIRPDGN